MRMMNAGGSLVQATRFVSAKHMSQWIFTDLDKGRYRVRMTQASKPIDCFNIIDVRFKASKPITSLLQNSFGNTGNDSTRYLSKIEDWEGVMRTPSALPLDLNSFRFLGGGANENKYLLFSDYFQLNDDSALNVITIQPQEENTRIRVMSEDANIQLKLSCLDQYYSETKSIASGTNFLTAFLPENNVCTLSLADFTKEQSSRRAYLQETV